jgi:hypothetical protein
MEKIMRIGGHHAVWIYDEVYSSEFWIIWPVNQAQLSAFVRDRYEIDDLDEDDVWDMRTAGLRDTRTNVIAMRDWIDDAESISLLAHECFHATHQTLANAGAIVGRKYSDPNEHYAYYLSSLLRRALKAIRKAVVNERKRVKQKDYKGGKRTRARRTQKPRKRIQ